MRHEVNPMDKIKAFIARIGGRLRGLIPERFKNRKPRKTPPIVRKILSLVGAVLCVIFGFMLLCNIIIIVKGAIYPDRPPSVFGTTPMVVLSGSMSGTAEDHIEVGDLIFVGKTKPEKLAAGDIIAYMDGKSVVTHRILEVTTAEDGSLQWTTKGDANNAADQNPVTTDQLIGIYRFRIPKVGDLALYMQTPVGMTLFIGLPLVAFVVYDLIRRQRFMKEEAFKNAEMKAELERLRELHGESSAPKADD